MEKKSSAINLRVQKRINSDIQELGSNLKELNENGIYWHIDEDNLREIFIVITGQEGTPYANAPFFFKFTYPENYPLIPPEGKFCTSDGETRFNPNLYVEGKICLSILGTWSGPSWTPVMTMKTIIMSIIALVMSSEPLKNEPGWENASKQDIDEYNDVVEFRSLKVGIIDQLTNCQLCFRPMYEQMVERFKMDFMKIMERIERNLEKFKNPVVIKPRYGRQSKIDYSSLKTEMIELGKRLGASLPEPVKVIEPEPKLEPEQITTISVQQQIIPTKMPASGYELGLEVEYKGVNYKVQEFKSGKKYWKKLN